MHSAPPPAAPARLARLWLLPPCLLRVKWAARHRATYFEPAGIAHVADAVARCSISLGEAGATHAREVIREFTVYRAFQAFRTYMANAQMRKGHELLLDLLNLHRPWLNSRGVNVAVVEVDEADAAYVSCPLFRSARSMYVQGRPWVLLLRHGGRTIYEPVAQVSVAKKGGQVSALYEFDGGSKLPPQMQAAIDSMQQRCMGPAVQPPPADTAATVVGILSDQGLRPTRAVISPDFRVTGVLAADNRGRSVYVPLPSWDSMLTPLFWDLGAFVHVERVYTAMRHELPKQAALRLFEALHSRLQQLDFYRATSAGPAGGVLELAGGVAVPLPGPVPEAARGAIDDSNLFLGLVLPDARTAYISRAEAAEAQQAWYRAELASAIAQLPSLQEQLYYLRHPNNPLPLHAKRAKAMAHITPIVQQVAVTAGEGDAAAQRAAGAGGAEALGYGTGCASVRKKNVCEAAAPRCTWVAGAQQQKARCKLRVPQDSAAQLLLAERFVDELLTGEELLARGSGGINDYIVQARRSRRGVPGGAGQVVLLTDADLAVAGSDVARVLDAVRGVFDYKGGGPH